VVIVIVLILILKIQIKTTQLVPFACCQLRKTKGRTSKPIFASPVPCCLCALLPVRFYFQHKSSLAVDYSNEKLCILICILIKIRTKGAL
jgi:hypothetical protein